MPEHDAEEPIVNPGPSSTPALQGLLGYLNFSEGRPDPRFQGLVRRIGLL